MTGRFRHSGEQPNRLYCTVSRLILESTLAAHRGLYKLSHQFGGGAVVAGGAVGVDLPGVSGSGGQVPGGTMEVLTLAVACPEGLPPADVIFAYRGCSQPVPA